MQLSFIRQLPPNMTLHSTGILRVALMLLLDSMLKWIARLRRSSPHPDVGRPGQWRCKRAGPHSSFPPARSSDSGQVGCVSLRRQAIVVILPLH